MASSVQPVDSIMRPIIASTLACWRASRRAIRFSMASRPMAIGVRSFDHAVARRESRRSDGEPCGERRDFAGF